MSNNSINYRYTTSSTTGTFAGWSTTTSSTSTNRILTNHFTWTVPVAPPVIQPVYETRDVYAHRSGEGRYAAALTYSLKRWNPGSWTKMSSIRHFRSEQAANDFVTWCKSHAGTLYENQIEEYAMEAAL